MKSSKHYIGLIYFFMLCIANTAASQEIIHTSNFAIRDFNIIEENKLVFIEKRDIKSLNLISKTNDTLIDKEGFFIGGYGLNFYYAKDQKKIITASNELIKNRSSIRFYDIEKKDVNKYRVLYSKSVLDFFASPKDSLLFLSHKDSTIRVYKYGEKPWLKKLDSIKLNSFSREVMYHNNKVYYITDSGSIGLYDVNTRKNTIICKTNYRLINFKIDTIRQKIYASTMTGEIIIAKLDNILENDFVEIKLNSSVSEALEIFRSDYLLVGDWDGNINAINLNTLLIRNIKKLKHRIIKIVAKDNFFYTSTSRKRIEKWGFIPF